MDERERYETGMKVRRAVLGDAHVDAALAKRNDLTEAFQESNHPLCMGRNLEPPRPRAPDAQPYHRSHAGGAQPRRGTADAFARALKNGVTQEEIRETLLQSAIYCGVPAANSAFRIAQQVFSENA